MYCYIVSRHIALRYMAIHQSLRLWAAFFTQMGGRGTLFFKLGLIIDCGRLNKLISFGYITRS